MCITVFSQKGVTNLSSFKMTGTPTKDKFKTIKVSDHKNQMLFCFIITEFSFRGTLPTGIDILVACLIVLLRNWGFGDFGISESVNLGVRSGLNPAEFFSISFQKIFPFFP